MMPGGFPSPMPPSSPSAILIFGIFRPLRRQHVPLRQFYARAFMFCYFSLHASALVIIIELLAPVYFATDRDR
jgi:hypothetical protein